MTKKKIVFISVPQHVEVRDPNAVLDYTDCNDRIGVRIYDSSQEASWTYSRIAQFPQTKIFPVGYDAEASRIEWSADPGYTTYYLRGALDRTRSSVMTKSPGKGITRQHPYRANESTAMRQLKTTLEDYTDIYIECDETEYAMILAKTFGQNHGKLTYARIDDKVATHPDIQEFASSVDYLQLTESGLKAMLGKRATDSLARNMMLECELCVNNLIVTRRGGGAVARIDGVWYSQTHLRKTDKNPKAEKAFAGAAFASLMLGHDPARILDLGCTAAWANRYRMSWSNVEELEEISKKIAKRRVKLDERLLRGHRGKVNSTNRMAIYGVTAVFSIVMGLLV